MAKAVLISAIPPTFMKSERNPDGVPKEVVDGIRNGTANNRAQFYKDITMPFYGFNRPGATISEGIRENWWRQGMMGSIQAQYECVRVLSETEFYDDLAVIDVPVLVMHGEDDQICPFPRTGARSVKFLKQGTLKSYPGLPHGLPPAFWRGPEAIPESGSFMRILIILNADADSRTSVVREFDGLIEAYYLFRDAGMDVVVAASGGGSAGEPTGTGSRRDETAAPHAIRRFKADRQARDVMNDLLDLASVCAGDFDAALCLGLQRFDDSAGVMDRAGVLVAQLLAVTKPVAVIAPVHDYAPLDAGNGLLIVGNGNEACRLAANALLGTLGVR